MFRQEMNDGTPEPIDDGTEGTGFLFWGWVVVTVLNLGMVSVALALFAP